MLQFEGQRRQGTGRAVSWVLAVEVVTHPVYPDSGRALTFSVDLPFGSYDVVASAEDFIPDTGPAVLDLSDKDETVDLNITEQPGI